MTTIYAILSPTNGEAGFEWCIIRMTTTREAAVRAAAADYYGRKMTGGPFPLLSTRIRPAKEYEIEAYLALGNKVGG